MLAKCASVVPSRLFWCCHTTKLYLSQNWSSFMSPQGVTKPQWVKANIILIKSQNVCPLITCKNGCLIIRVTTINIRRTVLVHVHETTCHAMSLLPDTQNSGLRMRRECRERLPATTFTVMHVGISNPRWRVKRSRHFRRMRKLAILRIWQEAHESDWLFGIPVFFTRSQTIRTISNVHYLWWSTVIWHQVWLQIGL